MAARRAIATIPIAIPIFAPVFRPEELVVTEAACAVGADRDEDVTVAGTAVVAITPVVEVDADEADVCGIADVEKVVAEAILVELVVEVDCADVEVDALTVISGDFANSTPSEVSHASK